MPDPVILAFDTTTSLLSLAVSHRENLFHKQIPVENPSQDHTSLLFPVLAELLERAGVDYSGISHLATTKGPGSFTGIRIGLAALQGLQCTLNIPCFVPTTLSTLAFQGFQQAPAATALLALIDNKRSAYYGQIFTSDLRPVDSVKIWSHEEILAYSGDFLSGPCIISQYPFDKGIIPQDSLAVALTHYLTFLLRNSLPIEQDTTPFYLITPTYAKRPQHPTPQPT